MLSTIAFAAGLSILDWQRQDLVTAAEAEVKRIREMPASANKPILLAGALNDLGAHCFDTGMRREAERALLEALSIYRTLTETGPGIGWALGNLANLRGAQRRFSEAERLLGQAQASMSASYGPESPQVALISFGLAQTYLDTGRAAAARMLLERVLPAVEAAGASLLSGQAYHLLAQVASQEKRTADAIAAHRKSLAAWRASIGPRHPTYASGLTHLAVVLSRQDPVEAERLFREAIDVLETSFGRNHPYVGTALVLFSQHLGSMKRKDQAREVKRRGAEILASFERENPEARHLWDVKSLHAGKRK